MNDDGKTDKLVLPSDDEYMDDNDNTEGSSLPYGTGFGAATSSDNDDLLGLNGMYMYCNLGALCSHPCVNIEMQPSDDEME
jgi:hypothetical protein